MSIRMRHTKGQTGSRRSHHALVGMSVVTDKETGVLRLPHRINEATGMYRGKQIFTPKVRGEKSAKAKGPDTSRIGTSEGTQAPHVHEHAHVEHVNAEVKGSKGILGKIAAAARPKARSGFGGSN